MADTGLEARTGTDLIENLNAMLRELDGAELAELYSSIFTEDVEHVRGDEFEVVGESQIPEKPTERYADVVDSIIDRLHDLDVETGRLDTIVHETLSNKAASINNAGLDEQVRFLVDEAGLKGFIEGAGLDEPVAYDDAEYVIVLEAPHDEQEGIPWVYPTEKFVEWYERVFQGEDEGELKKGVALDDALTDLVLLGYRFHVV